MTISCRTDKIVQIVDKRACTVVVDVYEPKDPRGTVFCFHDLIENGSVFKELAEFLFDNGIRVVCPDLLGRGRSTYVGEPNAYVLQAELETARLVVARYGTGQDSLIGSGRGALLALSMTRYTEFVPRRMILADMIVRVKPEFYAEAQLTMELVNKVCETPEEIDRIREAEGEMLGIDVGPGNRPSLQRLLTRGRNGYEISCDKTLTFALDLPLTFDQSVALRATQVPTLMIYGRGSSYFDELLMDQVTSLNKNVKCIPNIGPFETVTFEDFHIHSTILGFLATRRWGKAQ